jgi:hypothetical protein
MTGINYVTDERGRKIAVQIDLKEHGALWEDFWDGSSRIRVGRERAFLTSSIGPSDQSGHAEVSKYRLDVKASAQKELDALDDVVFARIGRKIMTLTENPRPSGCKNSKAIRTPGESESVIGAWYTPSTKPSL